jgi:hypothetical protein
MARRLKRQCNIAHDTAARVAHIAKLRRGGRSRRVGWSRACNSEADIENVCRSRECPCPS